MSKALTIVGMGVSVLLLLIFALDMLAGVPFGGVSMTMDIAFVICAAVLGFLSYTTFAEQK
ncbi:hypothetical protein ACYFX5_06510 [Bremerella sp. T1]|uniref:hypothetical protein n=1 Tax=Bremerella sp. TYQ1 TaxID=3119568 RepID=UPI001CCE3B7A|nr:hypothetical protein [Bremerella volcania]UBM37910.1 hypothetical protein LA756_08455 [Bremerella volcania]